MLKTLWKGWLVFAEKFGTVQMVVFLTLLYILLLVFVAVPFRLLADPLRLKRGASQVSGWQAHPDVGDPSLFLSRQ
jgi:hypothetical protein